MPAAPPLILVLTITAVAFLYSSVGFGGATGYLAVMGLFDFPPNLMATTALILNVFVSGIAFVNFYRAGHVDKKLLLTFPIASVPAAFFGGFYKLDQQVYFLLLYSTLTYVALLMLFAKTPAETRQVSLAPPQPVVALIAGGLIGALSGAIGIGGGIILSPLVILAKWGSPKQAAATASGFILLNSISGLFGRFVGGNLAFGSLGAWLVPVGIMGALAGSYLGARYFSSIWVRRILGVVILITVIRFFLTFFAR